MELLTRFASDRKSPTPARLRSAAILRQEGKSIASVRRFRKYSPAEVRIAEELPTELT